VRSRRSALLVLFCVALLLRLLHVYAVADVLLDEPSEVGMDRWLAMRTGAAVADGDWLGGWTAEYDSAPGYAWGAGLLYGLFGHRWLPVVLLQAILGAAVVPLVFAIGRRLVSPRAGLVAATLAALYAPTIFYETLLVKFSLVPVTVAGLLLVTDRARETGAPGRIVLAGLVFGLLVAIRGNAVVLLPVIVWWIATPLALPTGTLRTLALVVAGAAVVLGPLFVRDRIAEARGQGTSLWGIHFYIAAHPGADGTYAPATGVTEDPIGHVVDARRIAEDAAGRTLSAGEVSLYWFRRGLEFVGAEPYRYAALQARKIRLMLAGFEEGTFGDDFDSAAEASWVLAWPLLSFGSICPLAILGLALTVGDARGRLLGAFVGTYAVSLLPFFVTGRYRLPIAVPMLVLAATCLVWLDQARRRGTYRVLVLAGAAMAVLSFGLPAEASDRWKLLGVLAVGLAALGYAPSSDDQSVA
jgi:4-amino-4-deoxy-L-arabinose transferase-like glycosyltransferase